jgi:hypothetical protein
VPLWPRRRLRACDDGTIEVRLSDRERDALRGLADELVAELDDPADPSLRRLFPPSYADDAVREAGYQMMMGDELRQRHLGAARLLGGTAEQERLDPEQATAWLQAINGVRLVLGTQLDITDDAAPVRIARDDPDLGRWAAYEFLSILLNELVEAMSA